MVRLWRHSLVVLGVLLLASCSAGPPTGQGGTDGGTPSDGGTTADGGRTGPVATSFSLDTADAASAQVDWSGGTVTATGSDGTTYTVTIPAGALSAQTKITVTPLEQVTVDGQTAPWQVGVELAPEGTLFLKPVTLEVTTTVSASSQGAITYVDAASSLFVPQAAGQTGTDFTASLWHFSAYLVAPISVPLLSRAAAAAIAAVSTPPKPIEIDSLVQLWIQTRALDLTALTASLKSAIDKAATDYGSAASGISSPTPAQTLGAVSLAGAVSGAGESSASGLDQAAELLYQRLVQALQIEIHQAQTYQDYVLLLPQVAEVHAIAAAYPAMLQGGAVVDPATLGNTLVTDMLYLADQDCDAARYPTGTTELDELIAALPSLGLSSPSLSDVKTDASTCTAPAITGVEVPAKYVSVEAAYNPGTGQTGTDNTDAEPQAAMTVSTGNTATATATATDASATASVDVSVDGKGNSVTLTLSAQSQATVASPQLSIADTTIGGLGTSGNVSIDVDHMRGPSLLKITWTETGPNNSGESATGLSGKVSTVSLWPSGSASGASSVSMPGLGYTMGSALPNGKVQVQVHLIANASQPATPKSGSASIGGTVTVQVLPDPQPAP